MECYLLKPEVFMMNCVDKAKKFLNMSIYDNHYIRFVDKDKLIKKLEKLGFSIVYEEEKSITSKTEIKSSTVLRIVAKYK